MERIIELDDDYSIDLSLVREPNNKHDPNAIKVIWNKYNERTDEEKEIHIGYIKKGLAATLAKEMDDGVEVTTSLDESFGGTDYDDGFYCLSIIVKVDREALNLKSSSTNGELIFKPDRFDASDLSECSKGDYVKMWVPKNSNTGDIYMFRKGTGNCKLGIVPSEFSKTVASFMNDKSKYCSGVISDLTDYECAIKVILESEEDNITRIEKDRCSSWTNEDWDKYRQNLTKKYNPTKPIFCYLNLDDPQVKAGQHLFIEFAPFDFYLQHPYAWYIILKDTNGKILCGKSSSGKLFIGPGKSDKRLMKAHFNSYKFSVEVVTPNRIDAYHKLIEIKLTPSKPRPQRVNIKPHIDNGKITIN